MRVLLVCLFGGWNQMAAGESIPRRFSNQHSHTARVVKLLPLFFAFGFVAMSSRHTHHKML
jgi:hypothetical protein